MARKYDWKGNSARADFMLQCDRACYGAEMRKKKGQPASVNALQCDRACYGAEMIEWSMLSICMALLQCDRACYGAEIGDGDAVGAALKFASM